MTLLAVAGLGRCGSSLTMQMLAAGGVPCVGRWPAFEVDATSHRPIGADWLHDFDGRAFKWLDPHHAPATSRAPPIAVLWLDRDPDEQARSQAKFAHLLRGLPLPSRSKLRGWSASLRHERRRCMAMLSGQLAAIVSFETILRDPEAYALQLGRLAWALLGLEFDARAAAGVCRPRGSRCQPGLDIELSLLAERGVLQERKDRD